MSDNDLPTCGHFYEGSRDGYNVEGVCVSDPAGQRGVRKSGPLTKKERAEGIIRRLEARLQSAERENARLRAILEDNVVGD